MLGGALAAVSHHPPAGFVIVGMAAVFGGGARVPIATLLMVAEMTGGYQLLIAAGLAVMLSFVIQINLSPWFKYTSLYEAQVAARSDSPAHVAEHIQIALQLLEKGKISLPPPITHVHLARRLAIRRRFGSTGWFAANDWSASTGKSVGWKAASVQSSYRSSRGYKGRGDIAR